MKIIFYVSANLQRIERADALIILRIRDEIRLQRLQKRENNNQERIQSLMGNALNIDIPFTYALCLKNWNRPKKIPTRI